MHRVLALSQIQADPPPRFYMVGVTYINPFGYRLCVFSHQSQCLILQCHTIHIILSVSEFKSALVPFIALLYILYTSQLQLPGSIFNLFFSFSVSQVWKFSGLCTLLSVCCIPQFSTVSLQGSCAKAAVSRT